MQLKYNHVLYYLQNSTFNKHLFKSEKSGNFYSKQINDQDGSKARKWGASSALPSWSAAVSQVDSVSEYISEHLYDKLIWLSKPYAGNIMTLGALLLNMVVVVGITMSTTNSDSRVPSSI